jgi:AraC-like DNA-binding protein
LILTKRWTILTCHMASKSLRRRPENNGRPDYRASSVLIENEEPYKGEKLRMWTSWIEMAGLRNVDHLNATKLKRVPLYIWRAGISQCTTDYVRHIKLADKRRNFAIELVTAGNAVVVQNGKQFIIGPGEVFLLHNYADRLWKTGSAGFLHKRSVQIDGPALDLLLRTTNLINFTRIKPKDPHKLAQLFKTANRLLGLQERGYQEALMELAFKIILEVSAPIRSFDYPRAITTALDMMNDRLQTTVSLTELAKAAFVSKGYLSRLFHKHFSMAPLSLYIRLKIERAKTLLANRDLSVKQIAEMCGYDDPYFFSRQFKKFAGFSPRAYRNAGAHAKY